MRQLIEEGLRIALLDWLTAQAEPLPDETPLERLAVLAFSVLHRTMPTRMWSVSVSQELLASPGLATHRSMVLRLAALAAAGISLRGYQSTSLERSEYNDMLLNDWGIHHLHLAEGPHPSRSSFKARTGDLLFVMPAGDRLLFLTVLPHQQWANDELIEVLHRNFPVVLEPYLLPITGLEYLPSPEQRLTARKAGLVVPTRAPDGRFYTPPGGGYATSGRNVRVVAAADWLLTWRHPEEFMRRVEHSGGSVPSQFSAIRFLLQADLRVHRVEFLNALPQRMPSRTRQLALLAESAGL